jgi:hypothetical protein
MIYCIKTEWWQLWKWPIAWDAPLQFWCKRYDFAALAYLPALVDYSIGWAFPTRTIPNWSDSWCLQCYYWLPCLLSGGLGAKRCLWLNPRKIACKYFTERRNFNAPCNSTITFDDASKKYASSSSCCAGSGAAFSASSTWQWHGGYFQCGIIQTTKAVIQLGFREGSPQ